MRHLRARNSPVRSHTAQGFPRWPYADAADLSPVQQHNLEQNWDIAATLRRNYFGQ